MIEHFKRASFAGNQKDQVTFRRLMARELLSTLEKLEDTGMTSEKAVTRMRTEFLLGEALKWPLIEIGLKVYWRQIYIN